MIDKIPRQLTENQKRGLRTLARQIVDLLELRLSIKNIKALNENLTRANQRINQQQDALVQSAKLQTMGAMASGICYELGNPLTGIDGLLKMLMDATGADRFNKNAFLENLVGIDNNIRRIERMVKTLRQFTLDDDLVIKKVDVHELMHDLVTLLRERFSNSGVKLLFDLPEVADFNGSYNQISQVLVNLLHNAFDATFGRPNAWVKITVELSEEDISFHITDSGAGLTVETREHLFKPFFTTKPIGKGIGLSLYISQGIVENHRGQLFFVQGAPNTTFTLKIPR
ncbi:MAG: sensor histidine kinase [Bacteriovoracaceae bacterium]